MTDLTSILEEVRERVASWSSSLPPEVEVASLLNRCPIAYSWKATYRSVLIRESSLLRMIDLGGAYLRLVDSGAILAARIVVRSAFETTALLAYLNKKIRAVVDGTLSMDEFDNVTKKALLGGKAQGDYLDPVQVLTAINHLAKNHPVVQEFYDRLSEDVHPNASGMIYSYATVDPETTSAVFESKFSSSKPIFAHTVSAGEMIFLLYEYHYNEVWLRAMEDLEHWLRDNEDMLASLRTFGPVQTHE